MKITCPHCGCDAIRPAGHVNRSLARGDKVYCSRRCSELARRKHKTVAMKREEKRLYDITYRAENRDKRLAQMRAYHKCTYDPVEAAVKRKARMPYHVEYCRRPEYRAAKAVYDRRYRAQKDYGEFWECALLADDIRKEALERMTPYEIRITNGTINKRQQRKRAAACAHRAEPEIGALASLERGQRR